MYSLVKESLSYAKEVVQFMNFEVGDQIQGRFKQDGDLEVPKR